MDKLLLLALLVFVFIAFVTVNALAQTPEQIIDQSVSEVSVPADSVSCPVQGGKIITASYQVDPINGHCGNSYTEPGLVCTCGTKGKRANAIDIDTSAGQDVVLPQIGGQFVNWKLVQTACSGRGVYPQCTDYNGGTGALLTFEAKLPNNEVWYLQLIHMDSSKINPLINSSNLFPSGLAVGKTDSANHVHVSIAKSTTGVPDDCSDKWMPADFICDPSKQVPTGSTTKSISGSQGKSNRVCTKVGSPTEPNPCEQAEQPIAGPGGPRPQAPEPSSDIRQSIINQFGITMNGFPDQYLRWAWEKFWEVSNTKFDSLVKGAIITVTSVANSRQVGCPGGQSVYLGQFGNEGAFKHALVHELGHVIRNCAGRENAQETAFLNANLAEGGVSIYGREAGRCTGSDNISEDYAEMVAYYLNPGYAVNGFLGREGCTSPVINLQAQFPLHYKVAHDVLGDY